MKRPSCKSIRAKSLACYSISPLSCQGWSIGVYRTGYFINHQKCGKPRQKQRTASLLIRHERKIGSLPEIDTNEEQYEISGLTSVVNSDGRHMTHRSGL
uniref:Uncharacterized protein n=1 Tax=Mesocestoides corti TaxID=53468 RepID=A0A5K3FYU8_MESCO